MQNHTWNKFKTNYEACLFHLRCIWAAKDTTHVQNVTGSLQNSKGSIHNKQGSV